jgi:DNA-binding Xre family transcriptional regulator
MATANNNHPRKQAFSFRRQVKKRLIDRDSNVTKLAEELKLARNTVSMAINHPSVLPTVKARIIHHLDLA